MPVIDQYTGRISMGESPAAEPGKGSYLTHLPLEEQRLWTNLFNLFGAVNFWISYLDGQAALEQPPKFITDPWIFKSANTEAQFANYSEMRGRYYDAYTRLVSEYERLKSEAPAVGLTGIEIGLITLVVAVSGAILLKLGGDLVTAFKKTSETIYLESYTEHMQAYNKVKQDFAARGEDLDAHLRETNKAAETVADDAGVNWPLLFKSAGDILKYGALLLGAFVLWKVFS